MRIARSELGYNRAGPEEFAAQVIAANIREGTRARLHPGRSRPGQREELREGPG